jgi:vacuolar-type H+-ATPase subunit H
MALYDFHVAKRTRFGRRPRANDLPTPRTSVLASPTGPGSAISAAEEGVGAGPAAPPESAAATVTNEQPGRDAARRIAAILGAAEETAGRIREEAERRMAERIAEGDRAAGYRVKAAEDEAAEILGEARAEAARVRDAAQEVKSKAASEALTTVAGAERTADEIEATAKADASRMLDEAEDRARTLVTDARAAADGVRDEGLELVSNLREMGNALRSNAERLLRDVQRIHSKMTGELDRATTAGDVPAARRRPAAGRGVSDTPDGDEPLDVPEFLPPPR